MTDHLTLSFRAREKSFFERRRCFLTEPLLTVIKQHDASELLLRQRCAGKRKTQIPGGAKGRRKNFGEDLRPPLPNRQRIVWSFEPFQPMIAGKTLSGTNAEKF